MIDCLDLEYELEEIDSVEYLGEFEDEYVYDIEVDDWTHTFIGNDILVHNSVYTTYGTLFKAMDKESQDRYNSDDDKVKFILKFNKEFVDKQNREWCEAIYNPRNGNSIHEFELETISKSCIYLKKKKYIKGLAYSKGKFFDKPKIYGTGIEIIKSTTPKLCRKILSDLIESLMFYYNGDNKKEYILYFNDVIRKYKNEFYNAPIEDISQSVSIGDYKKYVISEDPLILDKGTPVSVKAIARYNHLAIKNNEANKKIYSGKIKYYNILVDRKEDFFGFQAGELPSWAPPMYKFLQWDKNIIKPINRFLEVLDIPQLNANNELNVTLFD